MESLRNEHIARAKVKMKHSLRAIRRMPSCAPFNMAFQHTQHSGRFLRTYLSLRRLHNGGRLVRDETGGASNRGGDRAASHFHPPGIRRFGKEQRALGELKCPRLRIEGKDGVRAHSGKGEIGEFQLSARLVAGAHDVLILHHRSGGGRPRRCAQRWSDRHDVHFLPNHSLGKIGSRQARGRRG